MEPRHAESAGRSARRRTLAGALAVVSLLAAGSWSAARAAEIVFLEAGTATRHLANATDPEIGMTWVAPGFDDSSWATGPFGLGYETSPDGAQNLITTAVPEGTWSVYTRTVFNVTSLAQIESLILGADYDDAWAAWINGVEVYRSPETGAAPFAWAMGVGDHESSNADQPYYEYRDISANGIPLLQVGQNLLAVAVWNTGSTSSDLVLVPRLAANTDLALTRAPYLQLGRPTAITVRWRTSVPIGSRVLYGPAPDQLTQSLTDLAGVTEHVVTLTGLAPGTRYYYAIGTPNELLAGGDASHHFVTPPLPGTAKPTRVWILGDSGTGDANAMAVRDAYYAFTGTRETDLWLMLGDNAYQNGTDLEYQSKLFDIYAEMLRKSVLWPTIGNHDHASANSWLQDGPYYDIFSLPRAAEAGGVASGTEAYYSFDHANIHFIVLDSIGTDRSEFGAMAIWLENDLAATTQDWIIAYWHHPPYSKGQHNSDTEIELVEMREIFVPLLDQYGVDLTFTGHSHDYERSWPIVGHYGDSTTFTESMKVDSGSGLFGGDGPYQKAALGANPFSGIVHTVAGSSGHVTGGTLDHPAMFLSLNELGSVVLDVNGSRLDVRFLRNNGAIQDEFTIFKGPVVQPPIADFSAAPASGEAPLEVSFADASQNLPSSWAWDFQNDGVVDSTLASPTFDYAAPGIYSVKLTVSNVSGSDEMLALDSICSHMGTPGPVPSIDIAPDRATISWSPLPAVTRYDLARGSLDLLRSTDGDFAASASGCLEDDGTDTTALDPQSPASGAAFFYLVRGANCAGMTGTYDGGGPTQAGPRDPGLQGATGGCDCDALDDADADGLCNGFDLCTDSDGDGFGNPGFPANVCPLDNCPGASNPLQQDGDADSVGDLCDPCPVDPLNDAEGDGHCANADNCPVVANPSQSDLDLDGAGDACDICTDADGDGLGDPALPASVCPPDNCPAAANPLQENADADAFGDACDPCPVDPLNDAEGDGFCANLDNCPTIANASQANADGDAHGDACDGCVNDPLDDADRDGLCADVDNCPMIANASQADLDQDGVGNPCDSCQDTDGDGFGNPGYPTNICPTDNCPNSANPTQTDADGDGKGDVCDVCPNDPLNDADMDFVCGDIDNCPSISNPSQMDSDVDGVGNPCDACPLDAENDVDHDGRCANVDNCPVDANPSQANADGDTLGDACDPCPVDALNDADADGHCANVDNCPVDANPSQADFDLDLLGDVCDPDDDNDGAADAQDCLPLVRGVSQVPGAIGPSLRARKVGNSVQYSWLRGHQGHTTNLYRGTKGPTQDWQLRAACASSESPSTSWSDASTPSSGTLFFYLAAARNACGDSALYTAPVQITTACVPRNQNSDGDALLDLSDNCPLVTNASQADADGDFVGDVCDNCPATPNPDQADADADGAGDACE